MATPDSLRGPSTTNPWSGVARADDVHPTSNPAGCVLRGTGPIPRGTQLFEQQAGGRVIANFTGALVPIALGGFPADPTNGRSHVVTSLGGAQLRIDAATAPASALSRPTRRAIIPIAPGHVWISSAQRVRLVQATSTALTGEITVLGSGLAGRARERAGWDAFSLQRGAAQVMAVPGQRPALLEQGQRQLELYDQPERQRRLHLST